MIVSCICLSVLCFEGVKPRPCDPAIFPSDSKEDVTFCKMRTRVNADLPHSVVLLACVQLSMHAGYALQAFLI